MKKAMHHGASIFFTILVITLLLLVGPAKAVQVNISQPNDANAGEDVEFSLTVEIESQDSYLPIQYSEITITGPNGFEETCTIENENVSCPLDLEVSISYNSSIGYGYGYGYDHNYGYGYDFGYGYGNNPGAIFYDITWHTPENLDEGEYTAKARVHAESDENSHDYESGEKTFTITRILTFQPEMNILQFNDYNFQPTQLVMQTTQTDYEKEMWVYASIFSQGYLDLSLYDINDTIGAGYLTLEDNTSIVYDLIVIEKTATYYNLDYLITESTNSNYPVGQRELFGSVAQDGNTFIFNTIRMLEEYDGNENGDTIQHTIVLNHGVFRNLDAGNMTVNSTYIATDLTVHSDIDNIEIVEYTDSYCSMMYGMYQIAFNSEEGDENYDVRLDLNNDGRISISDFAMFASFYEDEFECAYHLFPAEIPEDDETEENETNGDNGNGGNGGGSSSGQGFWKPLPKNQVINQENPNEESNGEEVNNNQESNNQETLSGITGAAITDLIGGNLGVSILILILIILAYMQLFTSRKPLKGFRK